MTAALLPPDLSATATLFLVAASFVTSAMSAAMGIGGGVTLLALMAPLVPVSALVPVHGLVQLGSNVGRAALLARHAALGPITWFLAGAIVGSSVGGAVVTDLPDAALRIGIGLFVIWSAVARVPAVAAGGRWALSAGGAFSSVLTMFVGATGPFVMALLRQLELPRDALVSTAAVAMAIQHALKIIAFTVLGFAFEAWLGLVVAMVVAGFLGTFAGTRLLRRLPEPVFRKALATLLIVLGLNLVLSELYTLLVG